METPASTTVRTAASRDRSRASKTQETQRRRGSARTALIDAAMRLLAERSPSAITGRELADEANVNYGLVHHHFGGKDGLLGAGLQGLRDDFVRIFGDGPSLGLLTGDCHPYLRALVRSQVDYPSTVAPGSDFPIGTALVTAIASRLADRSGTDVDEVSVEAKARVIAMVSIQLCYSVFGPALLDGAGVGHRERVGVERELGTLYDALAVL